MSNYEQILKTFLSKYKNPDIAKRDVLNVFTSFNDLRPKLDDYVFNDGTRKTLLHLDGTIPVNYKGSVFNIPVCIWLGDTHPYNPPMVYVKPTSTMLIKSGRNVDQNGMVDLPYLREWRYPNSDLLGMIQILTIVFGEEPPVYSRAAAAQQNQYPPQGQTPYPPAGGGFPMPTPGMAGSPYPAQNTPYPSIPPGGYPQQQGSYPGQFSGYPAQKTGGYTGYPTPSGYTASTEVFGKERVEAALQSRYRPQAQTPHHPVAKEDSNITGSDSVDEITTGVTAVRNESSDDDSTEAYDEFDVVLRYKDNHGENITKVLKAGHGFEALKWRFVFKNKEKRNRLTQKLKATDIQVDCKDSSNVVIQADSVLKYADFQRKVKSLIVEETADVKVDDIYIDANEAKEVMKVVTATCPMFINQEVVTYMVGSSGRTRLWFVALDQVCSDSVLAFRKAQDYVRVVLKPK